MNAAQREPELHIMVDTRAYVSVSPPSYKHSNLSSMIFLSATVRDLEIFECFCDLRKVVA